MPEAVKVGDMAPDFNLPSQDGKMVRLSDFRGRKIVILYFYPKDYTAGCTLEARTFKDNYRAFQDEGAEVIGVSSDSVESHGRFSRDCDLPFTLLSDEGAKTRERYGVPNTLWVLPGRVTYVIDSEGTVRHVFSSQRPRQHVKEAIRILRSIGTEKASANHKDAARSMAEHPA